MHDELAQHSVVLEMFSHNKMKPGPIQVNNLVQAEKVTAAIYSRNTHQFESPQVWQDASGYRAVLFAIHVDMRTEKKKHYSMSPEIWREGNVSDAALQIGVRTTSHAPL